MSYDRIDGQSRVNPPQPPPKPPEIKKAVTEIVRDVQTAAAQIFKFGAQNQAAAQLKLKLNTQVTVQQVKAEPVNRDKIDFLKERLSDAGHLAVALSSPDFNKDLKPNQTETNILIGEIVRGDRAEDLLLNYFTNTNGSGQRNSTYDQQKTVAAAIGNAYRAGEISDTDLNNLAKKLGADKTAELVLTLNSDPNNTKAGGVVDTLGKQAEALGYTQAKALAYSSSEELISSHLPDAQNRQAAFNEVKNFIDNSPIKKYPSSDNVWGNGAAYRAEFTFAVANAARLTAKGDGYSQGDFDNLMKDLGPTMSNEVIARLSSTGTDSATNGALDLLGNTSERLAQSSDGDDKAKWTVNQYTAYTQSADLIKEHLTIADERMTAFDTLNHELVNSRDDVKLALKYDFTLLRQPAAMSGMTSLLETNGKEILDAKIGSGGTNYAGQADMVQFLQSSLYSPKTSPETAGRLKDVMQNYIDQTFAQGKGGNTTAGERIGALMGLHDVAFKRAYEEASTPEQKSKLEQLESEVVKTVLSKAAGALLAETGPVGSQVGDFVMGKVLDEIFKDRTPTPDQLGSEFLKLMEAKGIDITDATNYKDNLVAMIDVIRDGVQKQLSSGSLMQAQTDELQNVMNTLTTVEEKFRTRNLETVNEYDKTNGKLRDELDGWK